MEQVELGNHSRVNVSFRRLIPHFRFLRLLFVFVLFAFLWFLALAPYAHAAPLTVSDCSAPSGAPGRLVDTITAASSGDFINFSCSGTITLTSTITIARNTTLDGAGQNVTISGNNAVRVFYVNPGVTFNLQNLTVANGYLAWPNTGAGIDNYGTLTVTGSTLTGNSTGDSGGAIVNYGTLTVQNSTLSGNSAGWGGGIFNSQGAVTIKNSTLSGNSTLYSNSTGGGILNWQGTVTVTNSTIVGNAAPTGTGGGIRNSQGTLNFANTIIANSTSGGDCVNDTGTIGTNTNNLVGDGSCATGGVNFKSGDPLLGTLGNYSGSTQTIPLLPGSPAIDAGNDTTCAGLPGGNYDQRGMGRIGAHCDIGAFESRGFTLTQTGGDNQTTPVNTPFAQPLALNVTSAFGEPVNGGQVTFTAPSSGASTNPATNTVTITGGAVSQSVTANGTFGSYTVTASASGAASVTFNLQNLTIVHAKPGGLTSGACESWANACELSYALAQSRFGQEIWVAAGTYKPTSGTDRNQTFQLVNGVAVYGGFAGTETLRTQRNWTTNVTILSGDIGTVGDSSDNSYHVVTGATGATLDGVTVSGGNANGGNPYDRGAGMYNSNSSPTLTNVTFSGNSANALGGGMYNSNSSPTLTSVTFSGNSAYTAGGMYNDYSSPTLMNVTFSGNAASYGAGGMYNSSGSPTLTNVTFSGNSVWQVGGGMYNHYSNPTLTNVTFSGNSAACPYYGCGGGGLYNFQSSPTIRNSILWGNSAVNGAQIYNNGSAPTVTYSDVQGGYGGVGNINVDPLLAPLGNYGGSTQTIPLLPGSPVIDATSTNCPATDQRGVTRSSPSCDLGAYESRDFMLTKMGGDNQTTPIFTAFAQPLVLSVTSPYNEPVNGGKITFTAPGSGASAAITGSPATIASGSASVTVSANGKTGSYNVSASANGVALPVNFGLTNDRGNAMTSVTSFPNPSTLGQSTTFTATVSPSNATGTVQFFADGAPLGSPVTLSGGRATTSTVALAIGTHPITATYSGDTDFYGNTSSTYTQTIVPPLAYVKPGGLTSGYCDSWANACELSYALSQSSFGREIWVSAGTYKPTSGADRTATFQLKNGVAVYGGFAGTETARDQRNWTTNVTIVSGDLNGNDNTNVRCDEPTRADNSYRVVTGATGATLDGVTVSGGNANGSVPNTRGGGMYNYNYSSPTLINVNFSGNSAYDAGGGMYNYFYSSPTLTNVTFSGNSACSDSGEGGGMYNYGYSSPLLTNVTFSSNAAYFGGGMYNELNSSPMLTNITFSSNAAYFGGGMYNELNSSPTLTNVTFSGNSANDGGGMFNYNSSTPTIRNSIFWNARGGEIYSINTPIITDSVVQGGCPSGSSCTNVIAADPMLGSLGNYGGSTQTIPLLPSSSAIDAGDPANCPATDQRGQARDDLQCDIGAFERKMTDGNYVTLTPSTTITTTYGPARVGIQDLGSTHPGIITATKVITWSGGTPNNTLGAWWDLSAGTNSTGLNLGLELCYSDAEKGNFAENANSHFWRYSGGTWSDAGAVATYTGVSPNRCAQISGVTGLSRWTLATANPGGNPTGVLVMRWVAIPEPNAVRLEWQTLLDLGVSAYQVERALDGKTFVALGSQVPAIGGGTYSMRDTTLPRGKMATYRLVAIKANGTREVVGTVTGSLDNPIFLPLIKR